MLKLYDYKDYQRLIDMFLQPLNPIINTQGCAIDMPDAIATSYTEKESSIESLARILLGMMFASPNDPMINVCINKICNGTNPCSVNYWGKIDKCSQVIVEIFPILLFCVKEQRRLSTEAKANLISWAMQVNSVTVYQNNWQFFPILINIFVKRLGGEYNSSIIESSWVNIDSMYKGNGWYSDGHGTQCDYYVAFAYHFYSLLYAYYCPEDTYRNARIIERAHLFSDEYIYLFAESGESVPFGRSLTYKFAHVAYWAMFSNFITDKHKLGVVKGIINRNIRWWLNQDICTKDGVLANGYAYPNPFILEQYNGSASPYWVFKAFFFMLNPQSEFFEVEECPLPELAKSKYIPEAYMCVYRLKGHSFLFMNGQRNPWFCGNVAKYEKFCYSSLFGFCIPRTDCSYSTMSPDSTLVVHVGQSTMVRHNAKVVSNRPEVQISDWSPIPGLYIRSFVFPSVPWHVRIHYIMTSYYVEIRDFGFAISGDSSAVSEIYSPLQTSTIGLEHCAPNTNVIHRQVDIPYAKVEFPAGSHLFITAVYGGEGKPDHVPTLDSIYIRNHNLVAFGNKYLIPRMAMKEKIRFFINTLKALC